MELEELVKAIKKQISHECTALENQTKAEVEKIKAAAVEQGKKEAEVVAEQLIKQAQAEAKALQNKMNFKMALDWKHKKAAIKSELLQEVKEQVKQELKDFASSSNYKNWLKQAAAITLQRCQQLKKPEEAIEIQVREEDKEVVQLLLAEVPATVVLKNSNLPLGGLILKTNTITLDNSLQTRLNNYFQQNLPKLAEVIFYD